MSSSVAASMVERLDGLLDMTETPAGRAGDAFGDGLTSPGVKNPNPAGGVVEGEGFAAGGSARGTEDLTGQFDHISRKVAELAEEKDSLLAQLRAPRTQRSDAGGRGLGGGGGAGAGASAQAKQVSVGRAEAQQDKENTARGVRFSSPLLTPKSMAWVGEQHKDQHREHQPQQQQLQQEEHHKQRLHHAALVLKNSQLQTQHKGEEADSEGAAEHAIASLVREQRAWREALHVPATGEAETAQRWQRLLEDANEKVDAAGRDAARLRVLLQAKEMEVERVRQQNKIAEEHSTGVAASPLSPGFH